MSPTNALAGQRRSIELDFVLDIEASKWDQFVVGKLAKLCDRSTEVFEALKMLGVE